MDCHPLFFVFTALVLLMLDHTFAATKCCGPNQWTASVHQVVGDYNINQEYYTLLEVDNEFYYDAKNKKVASIQTITNETQPMLRGKAGDVRKVKKIFDYNMMKKWVIEQKKCVEMDLKENMLGPCIPDAATHISSQMMINEPVDVWFLQLKNKSQARATFTQNDCIPISSSVLTGGPDYKMTISLYQNVTATDIDQNIFDVPSFCKKNEKGNKFILPINPPSPWI